MAKTLTTPQLYIKEISDEVIRKNFQNLFDYFSAQNQLLGFKFMELVFQKAAAGTEQILPHGFGQIPLDIIISHISGPGTLTFNYGKFTAQNLSINVTDACRVRFFYGNYWNYQTTINPDKTEAQSIKGNP